jgi:hypothetical protein
MFEKKGSCLREVQRIWFAVLLCKYWHQVQKNGKDVLYL